MPLQLRSMASQFSKTTKTVAFQVTQKLFFLSSKRRSEFFLYCDAGTPNENVTYLDSVVTTNETYVFEDSFIILDRFLEPDEVHECIIFEGDDFLDTNFDTDREDDSHDVLGKFTYQRSDFEDNISYLVGDGVVEVFLVCGAC